ncbi:capsule biosynthesis protein [Actinobacillus porcinus]|uniref:capsular polysaccharide export protein, LipB/KpsS family n=1 Tax=Actinobacillus porcinus TaxID=51048 RepID=UPI002355B3FA|nr:capsule biosynthesis protein [Actinobacillus porcinus]
MKLSLLIADSLHINKRNFSSFFSFIEQNKIKTHFESSHKDWISLYGVYDTKLDILSSKIDFLSELDKNRLFEFTINSINIFSIARAEILTLISVQEEWFDHQYPTSLSDIFDKLYKFNRKSLLENMAAAWYWVDFWKNRLSELQSFSHCCVFSGGLIYQKALIEQLKYTPTKVMVMESLFTGNEYYCEERYSCIANNCDIKHLTVYNQKLKILKENFCYDKERTKAINKILLSNNKNVQQPVNSEDIHFELNGDIITIIAQVVNDFSVVEYNGLGLSTIAIYKELITKLVNNGFNIIVKTHPWEEKKNNIRFPLTKKVLEDFVLNSLDETKKSRVCIVDHYSIKKLFKISKWIIGLNSQGLLEAAFEGFKPIQLANAFYGKKGFTHDYSFYDIDSLINDINENNIRPLLSLKEFDAFEEFMTVLLQKQTISIHNSGLINLREVFAQDDIISLVDVTTKAKPIIKSTEAKSNQPQAEKTISVENKVAPLAPINVSKSMEKIAKEEKLNKKINKLKNNPRLFFSDSKTPIFRWLKIFFKKN